MIFGEHDLGARAPFPRIDLHPVPQRPHLLQPADAAGGAGDVRLLAPRGRASRPRAVRDRRGDARAVRRGPRAAADLPPGRRAAAAAAAPAKPVRPHREPEDPSRRRHPGRRAGTSNRRRFDGSGRERCCSTSASASWSSTRGTTSPGSTRPRGGCSGSTASPSTRTSSTSPSRCRRPPSGPRSMPPSPGRRRRRVHEVEVGRRPRRRSPVRRDRRPAVYPAGRAAIEGAIIELTDVTAPSATAGAGEDAPATARAGRRASTGGSSAPTTS